jgi:hypothetical protein
MPGCERPDCEARAALDLGYPGIAEHLTGLLLRPAVALRAVVAVLLARSLRGERRSEVATTCWRVVQVCKETE